MISITTKTGDKGVSGLANGVRQPKDSSFFEVIGTLDELNSWLGLVAANWQVSDQTERQFLYVIQDTLFRVGAEVAQSPKVKLTPSVLMQLEKRSTALQNSLAKDWHTKFLLPGGTVLGAQLDITRTVCRRCERIMVAHDRITPLSPILLRYINRLSDYLYLLRCSVNHTLAYTEKKFEVEAEGASQSQKIKPEK